MKNETELERIEAALDAVTRQMVAAAPQASPARRCPDLSQPGRLQGRASHPDRQVGRRNRRQSRSCNTCPARVWPDRRAFPRFRRSDILTQGIKLRRGAGLYRFLMPEARVPSRSFMRARTYLRQGNMELLHA